MPNSSMLVFPTNIMLASSSNCVTVAFSEGRNPVRILDAHVVGRVAVTMLSLTATVKPWLADRRRAIPHESARSQRYLLALTEVPPCPRAAMEVLGFCYTSESGFLEEQFVTPRDVRVAIMLGSLGATEDGKNLAFQRDIPPVAVPNSHTPHTHQSSPIDQRPPLARKTSSRNIASHNFHLD